MAEHIDPSPFSSSSCSWKEQPGLGLLREIRVSLRVFGSRKGLGSPVGHNHDTHGCGGASGVHTTVNVWTRDQSMPTGKLFVLGELLHNFSSKLLINAGKRGPCFSLFLLLLLILAGKSGAKSKLDAQAKRLHSLPLAVSLKDPSPTAATVESREGCQVAGRLPHYFLFL